MKSKEEIQELAQSLFKGNNKYYTGIIATREQKAFSEGYTAAQEVVKEDVKKIAVAFKDWCDSKTKNAQKSTFATFLNAFKSTAQLYDIFTQQNEKK